MPNNIPPIINEGKLLVSFDTLIIYTNIPHNYGLETISSWLEKCMDNIPGWISKS